MVLGYKCIIMEHGIMSIGICIRMPAMVIAPPPIRFYVGLGLGNRHVVHVHR